MPKGSKRREDLTGMRFGMLTAMKSTGVDKWGHTIWLCKCDCGNICESTAPLLKSGGKTSCGCDTQNRRRATVSAKMVGKRFGMLEILERRGSTDDGRALWLCRCDCGNELVIPTNIIKGKKHCGCQTKRLMSEASKGRLRKNGFKIHGDSNSRLYMVFIGMIDRCEREGHVQYANYGGRGIKVCDEWRHDYSAFREWALANGYAEGLTIDRIDNSKGYFPENCRWATMRQQANNRSSNIVVTYRGDTDTVANLARKYGKDRGLIYQRLRAGWSVEDSFDRPVNKSKWSKKRKESGGVQIKGSILAG